MGSEDEEKGSTVGSMDSVPNPALAPTGCVTLRLCYFPPRKLNEGDSALLAKPL